MKNPSKNDIIQRRVIEQRDANRKALLEQAAFIPKGEVYSFPKPVGIESQYEGKITYHAADQQYVYGIDDHGNELQIEHASNSFYSPVIHRVIKAIKDAIADVHGNYAHKPKPPLKRPTISTLATRRKTN